MTALPIGPAFAGLPLPFGLRGGLFGPRAAEAARPSHAGANPSEQVRSRITPAARQAAPDVTQRSDEELLQASIDGDRRAFGSLVERYRDELLHFLIRFLGSRSGAEDVFQETFLQVHLSAKTFDPTRRFKPWLFTIAANKARDHYRRHQRKAPLSLSASVAGDGEGDSFVDLLQANLPSPDAPIGDAERSAIVRTLIDSLPPHHREILLLSYFQKLSYNQIADSLEIPLGTVKSRLHSAVASFAAAWKNEQERIDRMNDRTSERSA